MKFKDYYKENVLPISPKKEGEGDFGDDAQTFSAQQVALDVDTKYGNVPPNKNKQKWKEARGFIKPDGKMERIGDMPHESFAQDLGYPIMVDGKLVNKKFPSSKMLGIATGLIRWSPETNAFSVLQPMTSEQIKVIKDIVKSYGFKNLMMDFLDKQGTLDYVSFDDADPRTFDAKIAGVQHKVNDRKLGQR